MLKRNAFPIGVWGALVLYVLAAAGMQACSGTRAAYQAAEGDPIKIATVVGEHYYALVKEAADLKASGALAGSSLERAQTAERSATPAVIELSNAVDAYKAVSSAETEAELQTALARAVTAVNNFINAVKRRPSS